MKKVNTLGESSLPFEDLTQTNTIFGGIIHIPKVLLS